MSHERTLVDGRVPEVLIIGGGFAGLSAARALRHAPVRITLIDRTNHHLFQPLLYQVANSSLAPSDVSAPIRLILRHQKNVTVLLGEVERIDADARAAWVRGHTEPLRYDYLVVATGTRHGYFGHPEWERLAPGLKSIGDAREVRRRFLLAFEKAEWEHDPEELQALLTFVVVGGGPTGVELAGTFPEMARSGLAEDFRRVDTRKAHVVLVEGGDRLLPSFPPRLSDRARRDLEGLGVELRLGKFVTGIDADGVTLNDGSRIRARSVFWAAGNAASPLGRSLGAELDSVGRVLVSRDLSVPNRPEVFVVGDLAAVRDDEGKWVPGVAPAANQMGTLAGKNIARRLRGEPGKEFHYFNKGELATIGRHRAVGAFRWIQFSGYIAWFAWAFIHILYLVGFRNKVSVMLQWAYKYFTMNRGVRLITETEYSIRTTGEHPAAIPTSKEMAQR